MAKAWLIDGGTGMPPKTIAISITMATAKPTVVASASKGAKMPPGTPTG